MSLPTLGSGKNKYLCTYKGKKVEVMADTQLEARDLAAKHFQARKPYDVEAYLVELAGKPYAQTTMFASDRSSLIRLASSLPKGSEDKKVLLNLLRNMKTGGVLPPNFWADSWDPTEQYLEPEHIAFLKAKLGPGPYQMAYAKGVKGMSRKLSRMGFKPAGPKIEILGDDFTSPSALVLWTDGAGMNLITIANEDDGDEIAVGSVTP